MATPDLLNNDWLVKLTTTLQGDYLEENSME